ncbi:MAG: cyclic nucleotide-binding domain-containing protein [Gammaproteobacteria bacterium]
MSRTATATNIHNSRCVDCHCRNTCLFATLSSGERAQWLNVSQCSKVSRGNDIYRQNEDVSALYVVKSGSFKSYFVSEDGCEQLVAFHYPGDVLGLDAFVKGSHHSNAAALETSSVCRISRSLVDKLAERNPGIWPLFIDAASRQIAERDEHLLVVAQRSARVRLAWFIHQISESLHARGYCSTEINLHMSRTEIANYLAMAVETVSRLFAEFEAEDVMQVNRRSIKIRDLNKLSIIACNEGAGKSPALRKVS